MLFCYYKKKNTFDSFLSNCLQFGWFPFWGPSYTFCRISANSPQIESKYNEIRTYYGKPYVYASYAIAFFIEASKTKQNKSYTIPHPSKIFVCQPYCLRIMGMHLMSRDFSAIFRFVYIYIENLANLQKATKSLYNDRMTQKMVRNVDKSD